MTRIIQIATSGSQLYALIDDGSVWALTWPRAPFARIGWEKLPPVPSEAPAPSQDSGAAQAATPPPAP